MDTYIDQGGGFDSVYISGIYHYANNIGFIFSDVSGGGSLPRILQHQVITVLQLVFQSPGFQIRPGDLVV